MTDTDTHDFFVADEDGLEWPYIIINVRPRRGRVAQATHAERAVAAMQALQDGIEEFDAYLVAHVQEFTRRDPARAALYKTVLHRFRECIAG